MNWVRRWVGSALSRRSSALCAIACAVFTFRAFLFEGGASASGAASTGRAQPTADRPDASFAMAGVASAWAVRATADLLCNGLCERPHAFRVYIFRWAGFLQRLSSRDLFELGELVGVTSTELPAMDSGEWDSIVIDGVRCLSGDSLSLLREALVELGWKADTWRDGKVYTTLGAATDDEEEMREMELASSAVDLDVLVRDQEEESGRSRQEELLKERLLVPRSCWDAARGPQVFFADPPVHLDPGDPDRHIEYDAGRVSYWDFRSEFVTMRAGVCFPPGSRIPQQETCDVVFTHSNQLPDNEAGETICRAPFGWRSETQVLSHDPGTEAGGLMFSQCSPVFLVDYPPGQQCTSATPYQAARQAPRNDQFSDTIFGRLFLDGIQLNLPSRYSWRRSAPAPRRAQRCRPLASAGMDRLPCATLAFTASHSAIQ